MQLAVISDLHLGRGDRSDRFGHEDSEFLRFLRYLERNFERVVLLGDVWETLASTRPLAQVEELALARAAHPEIAQRFQRSSYTYLHGNHDLVAAHIDGAPDTLSLKVDGLRLLFTHGHGYDRMARWLSETGVWLGGWLLRLGLGFVTQMFDTFDNALGGASIDPRRCAFQRWAVTMARQRASDVIVTGHTHMGARELHGNTLFLNSGACSGGELSFLSIDTARGEFRLNRGY